MALQICNPTLQTHTHTHAKEHYQYIGVSTEAENPILLTNVDGHKTGFLGPKPRPLLEVILVSCLSRLLTRNSPQSPKPNFYSVLAKLKNKTYKS